MLDHYQLHQANHSSILLKSTPPVNNTYLQIFIKNISVSRNFDFFIYCSGRYTVYGAEEDINQRFSLDNIMKLIKKGG
jgi:hypothetical protein